MAGVPEVLPLNTSRVFYRRGAGTSKTESKATFPVQHLSA